jgi:hypothetical protein
MYGPVSGSGARASRLGVELGSTAGVDQSELGDEVGVRSCEPEGDGARGVVGRCAAREVAPARLPLAGRSA